MKFTPFVNVVFGAGVGFAPLLEARNIGPTGVSQTKAASLATPAKYYTKQNVGSPTSASSSPSTPIPIVQVALNPEENPAKNEIENVATAEISTNTSNDEEERTAVVVQVKNYYGGKFDSDKKEYNWICGQLKPAVKNCIGAEQWMRYSIPYQKVSSAVRKYPVDECPRFLDKASDKCKCR